MCRRSHCRPKLRRRTCYNPVQQITEEVMRGWARFSKNLVKTVISIMASPLAFELGRRGEIKQTSASVRKRESQGWMLSWSERGRDWRTQMGLPLEFLVSSWQRLGNIRTKLLYSSGAMAYATAFLLESNGSFFFY